MVPSRVATSHSPDDARGDITDLDLASLGIPSEAEYVADYFRLTGRDDVENWHYYVVLSLYRLAAITQGVYKRGLDGNASSPEALSRAHKCRQLADVAWTLVEGAQ